MVFHISVMSEESKGFLLEIEIDARDTFLDLNRAILQAVKYPDDQLTSFYLCSEDGRRHEQIAREDLGFRSTGDGEDVYVMGETKLADFLEEEQLIDFIFDPINNRCFSLQVMEITPKKDLGKPIVARLQGTPPVQLKEPDFTLDKTGEEIVFDEDDMSDFYGSDDYEADELDSEGFEVSDNDY